MTELQLHEQGSPEYERATTPFNAAAIQRPAAVAVVRSNDDVAAALARAGDHDWTVTVQATGHSAATELGPGDLLIDTSGLDEVRIDPDTRTARVGAGVRWGDVQPRAWEHGLLGLAGSTGGVGCVGYHGGGGLGWLLRPYGLASARLRAVDYLDAGGRLRQAREEAADTVDVEALGAYRGGGGVGVATSIEFELVPVPDIWAGCLYWPATQAPTVAAGWPSAIERLGPGVTTALGVLRIPPVPDVPSSLHGQLVVRLLVAAADGRPSIAEAREVLSDLPEPLHDSLAPADPERLRTLHLDPPVPVPGLGDGRWLTAGALETAGDILTACGTGDDFPFGELELRHTDVPASTVAGAMTTPASPVVLHATGPAGDDAARHRTAEQLAVVRSAVARVDTGRPVAGFCDGRAEIPDALTPEVRHRLLRLWSTLDPDARLRRPAALAVDA